MDEKITTVEITNGDSQNNFNSLYSYLILLRNSQCILHFVQT